MERYVYFFLLLLFLTNHNLVYSQDFEIITKHSSSTQDFLYPDKPEEGVFAGNNIKTFGLGIGLQKFEKNIFRWRGHTKFRINYIQKGFRIPHQISGLTPEQLEIWAVDKYHFISVDILPTLIFGKKKIRPYVLAGLRIDFLLHNTSENYQEFYTMWQNYEWELRDHNSLTSGFILGFGFDFYDMLMIEFEFNQDFNFTPIIKRPDFIGRNVLFSLNLSTNISELKRKASR